MTGIHPFELYKLFVELRTHFNTVKFLYGTNRIKVKYQNFYRTNNYIIYEKMSNKISKKDAEKLFVSNFLHDPNISIHKLENSGARDIKNKWIKRLKNVDNMFEIEIRGIIKYMKYRKSIDLYNDICDIQIYESPQKQASDVGELLFTPSNDNNECENFISYLFRTLSPESLVILNDIYHLKYNYSFLRDAVEKEIEPKTNILAIYKYRSFIDVEGILGKKNYPKITTFYNNC